MPPEGKVGVSPVCILGEQRCREEEVALLGGPLGAAGRAGLGPQVAHRAHTAPLPTAPLQA